MSHFLFLDRDDVPSQAETSGAILGHGAAPPERPTVRWHSALKADQPVNLRRLVYDDFSSLVSFVPDVRIGWVPSASSDKGLLIGHFWHCRRFLWFNTVRWAESGRPLGRGLEFRSKGFHRAVGDHVPTDEIFDRVISKYPDESESASKAYVEFRTEIPADYEGVDSIALGHGFHELLERCGCVPTSVAIPRVFERTEQ